MKMKNVRVISVLLTALALSACGECCAQENGNEPVNLIVVCFEKGGAFLQWNTAGPWIFSKRPTEIEIGQLNMFRLNDQVYAVTALHVFNKKNFPISEHLRTWKHAVDGEEISFAEIMNWQALGFTHEPVDAKAPTLNARASIKSTPCVTLEEGFSDVQITGILEMTTDPAIIKQVGEVLTDQTSFGRRLLERAPQKPFLAMTVPNKCNEVLRGSSGALVWQDGFPVGVFVAAFMNTDKPSVVFIEPLLEPAVQTLK